MSTVEEDQKQRIIEAARAIVRETGHLDLPMRTLCSRAKVSMTAPYALFGSKSGVVSAILAVDQRKFARQRAGLKSADALEEHFDSLRIGMEFYAAKQAFYRALFRLSGAASHGEDDPARLNHPVFLARMHVARAQGLLRPTLDVEAFTEILTDLFSSGVRAWAHCNWDIGHLHRRLGYGYAIALAGAGTAQTARRMQQRAVEFERSSVKATRRAGRRRAASS